MVTKLETAALEGSIAKWRNIVLKKDVNLGAINCPLCQVFLLPRRGLSGQENDCVGCPVREKTGKPYCRETPYWDCAQDFFSLQPAETQAQCEAALAMYDFLVNLRAERQAGAKTPAPEQQKSTEAAWTPLRSCCAEDFLRKAKEKAEDALALKAQPQTRVDQSQSVFIVEHEDGAKTTLRITVEHEPKDAGSRAVHFPPYPHYPR